MKLTKGIKVKKLKIITNNKGNIIKYISKKDSVFKKFGEIYFSEVFEGKTKGWNLHKKNTCLICVPNGKVKFILFDGKKKINVILSKKNHKMLVIPPKIWFAFKSLVKTSLVANLLNNSHSKKETLKKDLKSEFDFK